MLRFLGGGRLLLAPAALGEGDLLREALARLGDCERLIGVQLRDRDAAADPTSDPPPDLPGSWWIPGEGGEEADVEAGGNGPFKAGVDAVLIPGTLHRAAAMHDGLGNVCGLTYRIGRQPGGAASSSSASPSSEEESASRPPFPTRCPALILADMLAAAVGASSSSSSSALSFRTSPLAAAASATCSDGPRGLLLVGPAGSGKTTLLRALTRAAALHLNKAVLVSDPEC